MRRRTIYSKRACMDDLKTGQIKWVERDCKGSIPGPVRCLTTMGPTGIVRNPAARTRYRRVGDRIVGNIIGCLEKSAIYWRHFDNGDLIEHTGSGQAVHSEEIELGHRDGCSAHVVALAITTPATP